MPFSVLDAMVGGEPWTVEATSYPSEEGVRCLGIGSRLAIRSILLTAASDPEERSRDIRETVSFRFPAPAVMASSASMQVRLTSFA